MGSPISANVVVRTLSSRQISTRGRSSGHSAVGQSIGSPSVASCKKRLNMLFSAVPPVLQIMMAAAFVILQASD